MARAALYVYTAVYLGRLHELFPVLASVRIVLVLGLASIVLALQTPAQERNALLAQREVRLVGALLGLAVLFLPFSVWPGGSWTFLADTYSRVLVFFVLVVALAASAGAVERLAHAVMISVALLGVFTIMGASLNTIYGVGAERAYASATYDPNDVALMMVCTLPLAVSGALALRGTARVFAAAVAVICVVATVLTVSRGGFIGLIAVFGMVLFRFGTASLPRRLAVLGVVVALIAVAGPSRYWDVMSTIWQPRAGASYVETGVYSRIEVWGNGLALLLQNPLTGVGIGTYEVAEGLSHGGRGQWTAAHNSFIQLGTELGLAGLAIFLILLGRSALNARRALAAAREGRSGVASIGWVAGAVEISLYAYVVVGFALSQAYAPIVYFLMALATALRLLAVRGATAVDTRPEPIALVRRTRRRVVMPRRPRPITESGR